MQIALTFSGGGFRAAAFALGSLSLLQRIKFEQGTLLDQVSILSTVSGGTITGARYTLGKKRNESFQTIYEGLYSFLSNSNLIIEALDHLAQEKNWKSERVRNLITAFSDIYDQKLFDGARFGELMTDAEGATFRHLSFNATDFANGLQFRFQWSEKIINPAEGEPERGIIGNNFLRVPYDFARDIRLADIMAASSCFPGGFEPINFPDDFKFSAVKNGDLLDQNKYPVGLMDGGIVDNQGIEPVLLAESRMKKNIPGDVTQNAIDLIIVCEVASPTMEGFKASQQHTSGWWKSLTPRIIGIVNAIFWVLSLIGIVWSFMGNCRPLMIVFSMLFTFTNVVWWLYRVAGKGLRGSGVPDEFLAPLGKLLRLKLFIYQNLLMNRYNSMLMLTMSVFLKHVRRLNYRTLYADKSWANRRIMNAIYELKTSERNTVDNKVKNGLLSNVLLPSTLIQENSDLAASMGTTLWFTKKELDEDKMLDAIIACGQYNTCWNLLEYIHLLKLNSDNTNSAHKQLIACEDQLMGLWRKFQMQPKGMVEHFF